MRESIREVSKLDSLSPPLSLSLFLSPSLQWEKQEKYFKKKKNTKILRFSPGNTSARNSLSSVTLCTLQYVKDAAKYSLHYTIIGSRTLVISVYQSPLPITTFERLRISFDCIATSLRIPIRWMLGFHLAKVYPGPNIFSEVRNVYGVSARYAAAAASCVKIYSYRSTVWVSARWVKRPRVERIRVLAGADCIRTLPRDAAGAEL